MPRSYFLIADTRLFLTFPPFSFFRCPFCYQTSDEDGTLRTSGGNSVGESLELRQSLGDATAAQVRCGHTHMAVSGVWVGSGSLEKGEGVAVRIPCIAHSMHCIRKQNQKTRHIK